MNNGLNFRDIAEQELDDPSLDQELFTRCLKHAKGDNQYARKIYLHRRIAELEKKKTNLDQREKWPMLIPLLVLYSLGTIGVLFFVFLFLANRLGWW